MTSSRRPRLVAIALAGLVVTAVTAWQAAARVTTPAQAAQEAMPPPPSLISVAVERRPLQRELVVETTLQPSSTAIVPIPEGPDAVITSVDVAVGKTVEAGDRLVQISGRPLLALSGAFPLYRDLAQGDAGPDVEQLQSGLRSAGFRIPASERRIGPATIAAIDRLYSQAGHPFGGAEEVRVGRSDIAFLPELPGTVVTSTARLGAVDVEDMALTIGYGAMALLGNAVLTADNELEPGLQAIVETTAGQTTATMTAVGEVLSVEGRDVRPVRLEPAEPLPPGDYRVRVRLAGDATPRLVVPTTALFMLDSQQVGVRRLDKPDEPLPVEVLLIADGFAAIEATTLGPGTRVVVGMLGGFED